MPDVYYDRFTRAKAWYKLLARGGRALQSAELNEIQSILRDALARLASQGLRDGEIVSGMDLAITGTTAQVSAGTIYHAGAFHDFAGATLQIAGTGEEIIGMLFTETVVTESEDPELLDPATANFNFGLPGAHRLVYGLTLALNNTAATPLFILRDGAQVISQQVDPTLATVYQLLARRTLDESGSYLVYGLRGRIEARDASTYYLVTEAGKAYVQGWEITQPVSIRTVVDRPLDTRAVLSEPHAYANGVNTYLINTAPAAAVTAVAAVVRKTDQNVTRGGTPGGSDTLPFTPVSAVINVKQGATTYTPTTDYLVTGNSLSWSPGGIEPSTGSTYTVTFDYVKQYATPADYSLTGGNTVDITAASEKPVDGSVMYFNYNAYLSRYDLLVMDREGALGIVKGNPDFSPFQPSPPAGRLLIATLYYPPNGAVADIEVRDSNLYRYTMEDIARIAERVKTLEYNTAVSDLEQSAFNVQLPTAKKAIFADGFHDFSKADTGHGDFSCAVDFDKTVTPAFDFTYFLLEGVSGERIMLGYTLTAAITQPFATGGVNINPYSTFTAGGAIALTPADDLSVHTTEIVVNKETRVPRNTFSFWIQQALAEGIWINSAIKRNQQGGYITPVPGTLLGRSETVTAHEVQINSLSSAKTVAVTGSFFTPLTDNLALTFDGTAKTLTPTGGTLAGTTTGTVKANASGAFTATFPVTAAVPGGVKSVVVTNGTDRAETQYVIGQVNRTTTLTRTNFRICPIAESFSVPEDMFIAAVDLFFAAKDATLPVEVSLRSMENGLPGTEVLARTTLLPSAINVSTTATTATQAVFATPAFCAAEVEYCFVLTTTSNDYYLYTARLGQRDIATNQLVTSNPFSGVLFLSSNNITWTPDQAADIKFTLYRAHFSSPSVVNFTPLTVDGSVFSVLSQQVTPAGSSVQWQYSTDGGSTYSALENNALVDTGAMISTLRIRATLSGNSRVSPVIGQFGQVIVVKWDATGAYTGRNVSLGSAYTGIDVYLDISKPSGTSVVAHYSTNAGSSWVSMGNGTAGQSVDESFTEYHWAAAGIGGSPTQMKLKVALGANTARTLVPRIRRLRMIAT